MILDARADLRGWQGRIELPGTPGPEAEAQIERMLDGHPLLAGGSTAALLDAVLTLPEGHRLDWTLGAQNGEWQLRRTQLTVEGGLGIGSSSTVQPPASSLSLTAAAACASCSTPIRAPVRTRCSNASRGCCARV